MIKRRLEVKVMDALKRSSAVALMGPRQVGKTTLALDIGESFPCEYLDLENTLDLEKVRDIVTFHLENRDKLIILDEVQRMLGRTGRGGAAQGHHDCERQDFW